MSKLLSYHIIGKGIKVVLLHGFLENKSMWNFLQYSDENLLQCISIDLPGHGNSINYFSVHTMEFMADKVVEVLEKESIHKEVHFLGHSMGGYVALALAKKHPEKVASLGLFFSSPFEDSKTKKTQRQRAATLAKNNKNEFIRLGIPNLFNYNNLKNLTEEIHQAKEMALTTSVIGITSALLGMKERQNNTDIITNNTIPIFWIYGEYDNAVDIKNIEFFLKDKPHIQEYRLPVGHMGHLESPEICSSIIHSFYKNL